MEYSPLLPENPGISATTESSRRGCRELEVPDHRSIRMDLARLRLNIVLEALRLGEQWRHPHLLAWLRLGARRAARKPKILALGVLTETESETHLGYFCLVKFDNLQ